MKEYLEFSVVFIKVLGKMSKLFAPGILFGAIIIYLIGMKKIKNLLN